MSKLIVRVKLNLNRLLTISIKALNMITTTFMFAIVMRIEFAQDALKNRKLRMELKGVKTENAFLRRQGTNGRNVVDKFLKTDAKIRTYTGFPNKKKLSITWSSR